MRSRRLLLTLTVLPLVVGAAQRPAAVAPLWTARYNGPGNSIDIGTALAVNPAGTTVFVAGSSWGSSTGQDAVTLAYRAGTGRSLWIARYTGSGNRPDTASAIAVSQDGGAVFVTGYTTRATGSHDQALLTIAYDATTGRRKWVATYDPFELGSSGAAIAISPDGTRVFVTGSSGSPGGSLEEDFVTLAFDAASGVLVWESRYVSEFDDSSNAIAVSPDGTKVVVTGEVCVLCQDDYGTIAYDAFNGNQLWVQTYNGPGNSQDFASAVQIDAIGRVYVTGTSFGFGTAQDYATVAYDLATGTQLWVSRYDDAASGYDVATALDLSPDGARLFVTGSAATVAYDAPTGTQLWAAVSVPVFAGSAVRATPDGTRVYVTGPGGAPDLNYFTVGYLVSTGAQVWSASYQGPAGADDGSLVLGLTPTGKLVFVTGESVGVGSDFDVATLAYKP